MTQKAAVIEMHEAGKDYNEIEETTGAKRTYIRTIISKHKKAPITERMGDEEDEEDEGDEPGEPKKEINNEGMEFTNDLEDKNTMAGGKMEDSKTGNEYHKAWVAKKAYECSCGCTLNRKSTYCPNCGTALNWEGF